MIGIPNTNASIKDRGQTAKEFVTKHSKILLHNEKYTLNDTMINDIIEDITRAIIVAINKEHLSNLI
jgi:hypothetical protein